MYLHALDKIHVKKYGKKKIQYLDFTKAPAELG